MIFQVPQGRLSTERSLRPALNSHSCSILHVFILARGEWGLASEKETA
jgi:hypothetical protein